MTLFDSYVMVDWSARSAPSPATPTADAIWIGCIRAGIEDPPLYARTRAAAMAWLADTLACECTAGRRVLVGFDFPFGYPRGFAERLAGKPDALALWDHLARRIEDAPDNANNRYAVAAAINAQFGGGPFWGRPRSAPFPAVPERKSSRAPVDLPEFRHVEAAARGAKSCWQLAYAGSVGSQALLGVAALHRLRADPRLSGAAVWPFETGLAPPAAPIVYSEIYPSLFAAAVAAGRASHRIKDAVQVRVAAAAYAAFDRAGALAAMFAAAPDLDPATRAIVAREEGWILGAGRVAA